MIRLFCLVARTYITADVVLFNQGVLETTLISIWHRLQLTTRDVCYSLNHIGYIPINKQYCSMKINTCRNNVKSEQYTFIETMPMPQDKNAQLNILVFFLRKPLV